MFSSLKRLTGSALVLVLLTCPVYAADITPEGAATLKALIQTQLEMRKNVQSASGGAYITEGELSVEPADGYYAVTFPHIKIKDAAEKTYDIGMIAANVIPGATPNEWKASIALPTPIRVLGPDNATIGQVDIGKQKAAGVWDTTMNSFVRLDAVYDTVAYKNILNNTTVKIDKIEAKNQLSRGANGFLSGPMNAVLSGWEITVPEDRAVFKMKDVNVDMTVKDFDPSISKAFEDQIGAIGQTGKSIGETASAAHGAGLYNLVTDLIGKSSDAFSSKISINDFKMTVPNPQTQKAEDVTLDFAGMSFDMSGFRAGSVKTSLQLKYNDLKSNGAPTEYTDLVPQNLDLALDVNHLPFTKLVDLGRPDASGANAGGMALMMVPQLLTDAGTNVTHKTALNSTLFNVVANGVLNADVKAVKGFTADQTMEFSGLDKVIAKLGAEAAKPNNPNAQSIQSVLQPLTILQMVGQKDAANPDKRTYKLVVDATGKTLLNGTDMTTLMGGMGGNSSAVPVPQVETSPAQ